MPTQSVKCIGVLLDEHLQWTKQSSHVKMKLDRAIGILSKLRYKSNPDILKITYHSLFGSHLLCGCQLWFQKNLWSLNQIQILQNSPLKKINIKKRHDSATLIYKELNILNFKDLIYLKNCLFMLRIENNKQLAASFSGLKCCVENHSYLT